MNGTAICVIVASLMFVSLIVANYFWLRRRTARYAADIEMKRVQLRQEMARREELETLVRVKDERYRILFNNTRDAVLVFPIAEDRPGRFVEVNDVACNKLEYTREELLRLTLTDITFAEVAQGPSVGLRRAEMVATSDAEMEYRTKKIAEREVVSLMKKVMDHAEVSYDCEYVSKTGKRIPMSVIAKRFDDRRNSLIMCTAHDITERLATKRALKESEQRFQDFFAHSPAGVALYTANRNLVDVNQACLKTFGIPDRAEFEKFNMFDNPFLAAAAKESLNRGETVRVEVEIDFETVKKLSLFVSGRTEKANLDILINNLGFDRDYRPKGYLVQVQDITKRCKAEAALRQSEKQLRHAEKLEAIGSVAGGIAHDFNNILTPILGYVELLLRGTPDMERIRLYLQEVHRASYRAKDLVGQILTFSRKTEKEGQPIHIIPIVKEVLVLIEASLPPTIKASRVIKVENDVIVADSTQMHQVLMNLCTNALHATKEKGGILEICVSDFVITGRNSSEFPNLEPGRYLRVSVTDSGCGIDKANLSRIFEPFFTTKKPGEGTGMGLAVVHGIVASFKGGISVDSEVGKGTTFHVVFPLVAEKEVEDIGPSAQLPTGSGCVLFIDDEIDITNLVSEMLKELGYTPVTTTSCPAAIEMFEANPEKFDVIVTDQVMSGMRGLEVARALLAIRKDVPVILCSGYKETFSKETEEFAGIFDVLRKPIEMQELAVVLSRATEWIRKLRNHPIP